MGVRRIVQVESVDCAYRTRATRRGSRALPKRAGGSLGGRFGRQRLHNVAGSILQTMSPPAPLRPRAGATGRRHLRDRGLLGPQEPVEGVAELRPPVLEGMATPIAMAVHFTTVFVEYCASPFDTCDLRDALKETSWRVADLCVGLFVANAEPEPCLHRGTLLSQPSKCIWLEPKRSRLTERSGKPCRIQQRYVRGGETAETQSTDQVPLCRKARDSCPRSAHDIVGDEPGELRVTDVVRVPSRGPPMRHEDQGHRRNASALHQRRENRKRMNAVSVVLTVKEYAQRVLRLWPFDEPCGPHVLALRALDAHLLSEHGSNLPGCSLASAHPVGGDPSRSLVAVHFEPSTLMNLRSDPVVAESGEVFGPIGLRDSEQKCSSDRRNVPAGTLAVENQPEGSALSRLGAR
jgi:hypothetical protein